MKTRNQYLLLLCMLFSMSAHSQQNNKEHARICRIWNGWTTPENADKLETALTKEAIPAFERNKPEGYLGIQVLRQTVDNEVKFTTLMWFTSIEAVKNFAGEQYTNAHMDDSVKPLLIRYDTTVTHAQISYSSYR